MKLLNWIRKNKAAKKQKLELSEKEETERKVTEEKGRKTIEKYKIEIIGFGWLLLPGLIGFVLIILFIGDILLNKGKDWLLFVPFGVIGLLATPAFNMSDEWEREIKTKNNAGTASKYDSGYLYTDSKFNYLGYKYGKILLYLINVLVVLIALIWVLISIGNTTPSIYNQNALIIFLLIIIAIGVWLKR